MIRASRSDSDRPAVPDEAPEIRGQNELEIRRDHVTLRGGFRCTVRGRYAKLIGCIECVVFGDDAQLIECARCAVYGDRALLAGHSSVAFGRYAEAYGARHTIIGKHGSCIDTSSTRYGPSLAGNKNADRRGANATNDDRDGSKDGLACGL